MTFLSLFAFGKEYILINDSFVIMTVMGLLLALIIKNLSNMLKENFENSRKSTQDDLSYIINNVLKYSLAYRSRLEDLILLNLHRGFLIPSFHKNEGENYNPEKKIQEVFFEY